MLTPPNCIAFIADMTERKLAETGRAHAERALLRTEEQLQHAQKMEAVGRLAGGVAHNFNNVLCLVLSYGDLILQDLPPPPTRCVQTWKRSSWPRREPPASRASCCCSAARRWVQPKVIDLHEILVGLMRMLRRIVGEDVDLTLVAPAMKGRVHADPGHVEQVILNLVVNARDAMSTGGKLTIETSNVELDDAWATAHLPASAART